MDVQLPEEPNLKIRVWTHLLTQLIRGSSWVRILGPVGSKLEYLDANV